MLIQSSDMWEYVRTNGEKEILEGTWVLHKKIEQFYLKELAWRDKRELDGGKKSSTTGFSFTKMPGKLSMYMHIPVCH